MFWRFGGYASLSSIDSLLEKSDVTIEEILDESDLIQELKSQNSKLIEFLRDDNVLDRLLQYIVLPKAPEDESASEVEPEQEEESGSANPLNSLFGGTRKLRSRSRSSKDQEEESKDEKQRLKYAYVSSEILSSDVWSISEALLDNKESLSRFWTYLKKKSPLDPVQAGHFTKVNESLFEKKTEDMLIFFKSIDGVIADMLQHVDCPVIMDLLLKIISLERSEGGQGTIDWLQSQDLISLLLSKLSPEHEASTQTSAGDFMKAIITISANATAQDNNVIGPNELTRQLVSEECIQMLINDMLRGGNPLTVGVGIVIEVIRKNNSDYDLENQSGPVPKSTDPIYLGTLLRQFALHIPEFMKLIQSAEASKKELKVAFGRKIEPLGFDRFKTCELMAELLHCSNMILLNQRGSDADIKAKDAERSRLKAEGKLTAFNDDTSIQEFGTSVDSSGFHHARAPSFGDSVDKIKRLEVSNSTDEDFENVTASEALVDEIKDDFDEKDAEPDTTAATLKDIDQSIKELGDITSTTVEGPSGGKTPTSELSDTLDAIAIEEQKPSSPKTPKKKSGSRDLTSTIKPADLSPHPEDKPAPLFASKPKVEDTASSTEHTETEPTEEEMTVFSEGIEHDLPYETDFDGSPVVGDLLKMKFVEHKVVPTILDFFFRFPWNNFLHNVVYDVVQQVFNGQMERGFNRSLAIDLFDTARITDRIIEGQKASDQAQRDSKMRLGYMGHLTLIAEEVVKFAERIPPETLSQLVLEKVTASEWIDYVEHTLAETRERDNAILGGVRPDVSLGPRQAVLNAVGASSVISGLGGSLSSLTGNSGLGGLENVELSNNTANNSNSTYLFSGSSLMSGFSHGSSDEEDEDMDEGEPERRSILDDSDQIPHDDDAPTSSSGSDPITIPAPLSLPTQTRARRQFAARLAARKKEQEALAAAAAATDATHTTVHEDEDDEDDDDDERVGGASSLTGRLSRVALDDDSDADDDVDGPDDIEDVERLVDVDVDELFGSDDSFEGEDVGIVMKKVGGRWGIAPREGGGRKVVTERVGKEREAFD